MAVLISILLVIADFPLEVFGLITTPMEIFILLALAYRLISGDLCVKHMSGILPVILFFFGTVITAILGIYRNSDFDLMSHIFMTVRGMLAFLLLFSNIFPRIPSKKLLLILETTFIIHLVFLFLDLSGLLSFDFTKREIMLADGWNPRPSGLFQEPSFYGLYLGLNLYIFKISNYMRIRHLALGFLAALLSTSLIGIILVFTVTLFYFHSIGRMLYFLPLIVAGFLLMPKHAQDRLGNLSDDGSAQKRVLGSFLAGKRVLQDYPIFGVGFGTKNAGDYLSAGQDVLFSFLLTKESRDCYNKGLCDPRIRAGSTSIISGILLSSGVFGMIFYFLTIRSFLNFMEFDVQLMILLIIVLLAFGRIFDFGLFLSLYFVSSVKQLSK